MNKTGRIFSIQRFSVDDGPGIRTTVFFKGCDLHCYWCHNPESWRSARELQVTRHLCIGCRRCEAACPRRCHTERNGTPLFDRASCVACGACAEVCPTGALTVVGDDRSADDLLAEIVKDRAFFENSGGGVTFSGGECMLQIDFLEELIKAYKREGIHTAIETAGFVPFSHFERVLPFTDLFLFDVKCRDEALHKRGTGQSNARILENLRAVSEQNKPIVVRVPLVGGFNDDDAEIMGICEYLKSLPAIPPLQFMPYHSFGEGKKEALGLAAQTLNAEISPEKLAHFQSLVRAAGITVIG